MVFIAKIAILFGGLATFAIAQAPPPPDTAYIDSARKAALARSIADQPQRLPPESSTSRGETVAHRLGLGPIEIRAAFAGLLWNAWMVFGVVALTSRKQETVKAGRWMLRTGAIVFGVLSVAAAFALMAIGGR